MLKFIFRTDASFDIGNGHVMRCLTLADALRERGAHCDFICREHPGHLIDLIRQRGYEVFCLSLEVDSLNLQDELAHAAWLGANWRRDAELTERVLKNIHDVDWLIVDHYALDYRWEQALRSDCKKIMVIDDLADRKHDCDLLLDQNLGRKPKDYEQLVPEDCKLLIGPQYALLRPEFARLREYSLARRKNTQLKKILISMGGVDKENITGQVLDALKNSNLPEGLEITVVMGPNAPWLNEVRQKVVGMPWPTEVFVGIHNMAEVMSNSDLAIGAAGSSSWERCCLGLPAIQFVLAKNQSEAAMGLESLHAAILLQMSDNLEAIFEQFNSEQMKSLTDTSSSICNGRGSEIISEHLHRHSIKINA